MVTKENGALFSEFFFTASKSKLSKNTDFSTLEPPQLLPRRTNEVAVFTILCGLVAYITGKN